MHFESKVTLREHQIGPTEDSTWNGTFSEYVSWSTSHSLLTNTAGEFIEIFFLRKDMRIHIMQLWMRGFIRNQGGRSPEGKMGLNSLESYKLKNPSGPNFAKFRKSHATFQMKYCNSLLSFLVKGTARLILLGLRVPYKVSSVRPWSGCGPLDLLIRGFLATAKGFPHPGMRNSSFREISASWRCLEYSWFTNPDKHCGI